MILGRASGIFPSKPTNQKKESLSKIFSNFYEQKVIRRNKTIKNLILWCTDIICCKDEYILIWKMQTKNVNLDCAILEQKLKRKS